MERRAVTHIRFHFNMLAPISQTCTHLERITGRVLRRRRCCRNNRRFDSSRTFCALALTSRPMMHFLLLIRLGKWHRRYGCLSLSFGNILRRHLATLKQFLLLNVALDITIHLPELFRTEPAMLELNAAIGWRRVGKALEVVLWEHLVELLLHL